MAARHHLSRRDVRRIAVRAQLLARPRPTNVLDVLRHLTLLQVDFTTAVVPHVDLALWSRIGAAYQPRELDSLLGEGRVVEYQLRLRPMEDISLFRAEWEVWPGPEPLSPWQVQLEEWVDANAASRAEILDRLAVDGPLPGAELPNTCALPWRSSGWNNDRSRARLLDQMVARGEVAVARREGRLPLWDLAERVYAVSAAVPLGEARARRAGRRLAALGVERSKRAIAPDDDVMGVGQAGEPCTIEGLKGEWRVDPTALAQVGEFEGRTVLLSPLDRLVFDRRRMVELFEFDYQLEMYKPVAQRRWGYWALPVLDGDELVGKIDCTTELDRGILRVDAIHEDGHWSTARRRRVDAELESLAAWMGVRAYRN